MNIFEKRDDAHSLFISQAMAMQKTWLDICVKSHTSDYPSKRNMSNWVSTLFNFERQHLYHIYWSTGRQLSSKRSVLVICKSLRMFVNTVSAVDNCFLPNRDNLMTPIHMHLSQKVQTFSQFFSAFSKCWLNLEHFQKKDDDHSRFISEATACEKRGWIYV